MSEKQMVVRRTLIVCAISAAVVSLLALALYLFVFRDRWEDENRQQITDLAAQAEQLVAEGEFREGHAKYEELFRLVDGHPLRSGFLRDTLDTARTAQEGALALAQKQEEQKRIATERADAELHENEALSRQTTAQAEAAFLRKRNSENVRAPSVAVDRGWKSLPLGFEGNDAWLLREEMERRLSPLLKKSEFSTASEHAAGIELAMVSPLLGTLDRQSIFAFTYRPEWTYDAERGEFTSSLPPLREGREIELGQRLWRGSQLTTEASSLSDYLRSDYVTLELGPVGQGASAVAARLQFPMRASEAKTAKEHLRCLLLCRLVPPYFRQYLQTSVDNTARRLHRQDVILVAPVELWIVRLDTREVLLKLGPWEAEPANAILTAVADALASHIPGGNANAKVTPSGNTLRGTITFGDASLTSDGIYSLDYEWKEGSWLLRGGTYNPKKGILDGSEGRAVSPVTLAPQYGSERPSVPLSVQNAFADVLMFHRATILTK